MFLQQCVLTGQAGICLWMKHRLERDRHTNTRWVRRWGLPHIPMASTDFAVADAIRLGPVSSYKLHWLGLGYKAAARRDHHVGHVRTGRPF